jgi:hypothetical protein
MRISMAGIIQMRTMVSHQRKIRVFSPFYIDFHGSTPRSLLVGPDGSVSREGVRTHKRIDPRE